MSDTELENVIKGLTKTKEIDLSSNNIGVKGVKLLIQHVIRNEESRLESLNLENNSIGDIGTRLLC